MRPAFFDRRAQLMDLLRARLTLGLALQRLRTERIQGAIAEVGVWRGDTSVFLRRVAPERRLYLFDTFEGFPARDTPPGRYDGRFQDTSAEAVERRLGGGGDVQVVAGYVPDTLQVAAKERFAFVLLDLDLFAPTLASLEFFYPRLEPGGYLIVHDYNNAESEWACRRALDHFLADKPERLVEIGDVWGSAIVRRSS
jgi:O-methyltransferase